jgi:hypothetical protein
MTSPESETKLQELITVGTQLLEQISQFADQSGTQFVSLAQRARANRRAIIALGISLFLDIVLTFVTVFAWVQVSNNEHKISDLTARLDYSQTVQRQKALCPLYQLLLDSKSTASRNASPDPKAYDHAFDVIGQGYAALDCSAYITDPNSSGVTTPTTN